MADKTRPPKRPSRQRFRNDISPHALEPGGSEPELPRLNGKVKAKLPSEKNSVDRDDVGGDGAELGEIVARVVRLRIDPLDVFELEPQALQPSATRLVD